MDIHERIAHARQVAGLRQDDIAAHFGISRVSVAQWEGKRSKPAMGRIIELADLLNTTPDWLIHGRGEPPVKSDKPSAIHGAEDIAITPELEAEFLDRLRRADPAVREGILKILGIPSHAK